MMRTGRNDPCPCGSGRKYKKCCSNVVRPQFREPASATAAGKAINWLEKNYRRKFASALRDQYACGRDQDFWAEIAALPAGMRQMVEINTCEWCLVEGRLDPDSSSPRFIELALKSFPAGEEREYLELMARSHLDLYEAVEVEPEAGMWLSPVLQANPKRIWIKERSASQTLHAGTILGCRVVPTDPPVMSGAVYPFTPDQYLRLRSQIMPQLSGKRDSEPGWVGRCIIDAWLNALLAPPPMLMDASSGDPILLTTIHYRVRDWDQLERVFAQQKDVRREDEGCWIRFDPSQSQIRPLCTLYKKPNSRLEAFTRTAAYADRAEEWLAQLAGEMLQPLDRVASDPRQLWKDRYSSGESERARDDPMARMTRRERSKLMQRVAERTYADWADQPVPMLGGKTPREASRSEALRREVAELLRSYQTADNGQASRENRDPVDFGFLWKEIGLSPREFER